MRFQTLLLSVPLGYSSAPPVAPSGGTLGLGSQRMTSQRVNPNQTSCCLAKFRFNVIRDSSDNRRAIQFRSGLADFVWQSE